MNDTAQDFWLVADIGGTQARFGVAHAGAVRATDVVALRCADFASVEDAALAYLSRQAEGSPPGRPSAVALALACAVDGDTVRMTNSPWTVSKAAVQAALGTRDVRFLNDFEALALAAPHLQPDDVARLGGGDFDARRPMALIGPGTGLGVAGVIPAGAGRWIALPSEGGHVTLPAADDFEAEVLRMVRAEHAHVSAERLISGLGLPTLYRAVSAVCALPHDPGLTAADITRRGLDGNDPACVRTLDTFCAMLGSVAGNLVLTLGARGGLLLAGGVATALRDLLPRSRFGERFEGKGRFRDYLAPTARGLVIAPHAALDGALRCLATQRVD
ncbi:MAG: glucokinase [Burkholderiaceae bacterium]|nr:glucokinase [Burkholderiaceae bacterium]